MIEIAERLARIESGLAEHMRRTEIAERRLNIVEDMQHQTLQRQAQWAGAGKLLAVLGTVSGVVAALARVLA